MRACRHPRRGRAAGDHPVDQREQAAQDDDDKCKGHFVLIPQIGLGRIGPARKGWRKLPARMPE